LRAVTQYCQLPSRLSIQKGWYAANKSMLHLLVKPQLMHRCGTSCGCDTSHLIFLSSPIRALGNAIQETACVGGPDPVAGAVVPYDQKLLPTSSSTQVSGSACGPFGPGMLGIRISEEEYAPEKQIPRTLIVIAIVRTFIIIHFVNADRAPFASLMAEAPLSVPRGLRAHLRIGTSIALLTHS
jgi:hypothetical protein